MAEKFIRPGSPGRRTMAQYVAAIKKKEAAARVDQKLWYRLSFSLAHPPPAP